MMESVEAADENKRDLWIPRAFVGFFIGLAILESGFITLAYRSFTGVVTDQPYAEGLNYNQNLAAREAEKALGWTVQSHFISNSSLTGRMTLDLSDKDGHILKDATVLATAERMTEFPQVLPVTFKEDNPGQQVSSFTLPLPGRWFIRLKVTKDGHAIHKIIEVEVSP
jgi:nitrogen fixation protein FixH